VNREPHLESLLRTLKLPGMADMLGERLAQAAAGKLGHAELLALLCGDEVARRDAAGLSRRLAAARFESTARSRTSTSPTTPTSPPA
jgi:DNA replication protein DnaC